MMGSTSRNDRNARHRQPPRRRSASARSIHGLVLLLSTSSCCMDSLYAFVGPNVFYRGNRQQHTCESTSRRYVSQLPKAPLNAPPLEEDDGKNMLDNESNDFDAFDDLPASQFYDIDYNDDDDAISVDDSSALDSELLRKFAREEADMLEEREDRMYDVDGRIAERCVLVGVEDVSAVRRQRRKQRKRQEELFFNSDGSLASSNIEQSADDEEEDAVFTLEESLTEMRELVKTAGMDIAGEVTQRLNEINPRTYINTGKVSEAKELLKEVDCSTIVFDAELSPGQQKTLENAFNKNLLQNDFLVQEREIKVIDRTALILDIFAQHARTREGKLQVDLALHEYRKPRLTRMWTHLERQSGAGGVGLRGPGESQLEIDKRLVRDRIITLKQKINGIQKQRTMRRRGRERMGLPILSLVGYTNAGKSTVLNYLTRAGVMAESMLFATLDPTTRKVKLPGLKTHPEVLLTDTVGFIQKLPTHLVAAFRATLEEVKEADVLVHVIDVANPTWQKQEQAVRAVLEDIGAADKPIVRVLNKIDLLDSHVAEDLRYEAAVGENSVAVSALTGDGISDMVACIEDALADLLVPIEVVIPYSKGEELNSVHEQGNVEAIDYRDVGTYVRALVPESVANRLEQYNVNRSSEETKEKDANEGEMDWAALGRGRH